MFIAVCPTLPGCVSQGRTEAEAAANVSDAMRECMAVRFEQLDWSQCPGAERMPVESVLENLAAGRSAKEISEAFDVTEDGVMAILRFVTSSAAAA